MAHDNTIAHSYDTNKHTPDASHIVPLTLVTAA
jgi:hypothetical protein